VASADALTAAGVGGRDGIVVLDVSNPLTFTAAGPALAVANTDSLAEVLQRAFPAAHVVKSLEASVLLWWSMTQSFGTFDLNVEVRTA
jgi:predicted dinucleotide-binding enzyme